MPLTSRRASGSPSEERNGFYGEKDSTNVGRAVHNLGPAIDAQYSDVKDAIDLTPNIPEESKKKKGLGAATISEQS